MKELIKIENHEFSAKEYKGQRVVTFKDIDTVHERARGTAKRNFNANKKRFVEDVDFFTVCASEIRTNNIMDISDKAHQDIVLITESGYLMLVKSFTDDLAWKVQRELVQSYFRKPQPVKPMTTMEQIQLLAKGYMELEQKIAGIDKDLQEFKRDMPLLGVECQKIARAKNRKVVPLMGGKEAPAYKDNSLRGKVYRDIDDQLRREFDVDTYKAIKRNQVDVAVGVIESYQLPMALKERIDLRNGQMDLAQLEGSL